MAQIKTDPKSSLPFCPGCMQRLESVTVPIVAEGDRLAGARANQIEVFTREHDRCPEPPKNRGY